MYYSYDPEDGIKFHATAKEAKARAQKSLEDAEFHAADSDWSWVGNEEEISWGRVNGKVNYHDRPLTSDEKREMPDFDRIRNPSLDRVTK